MKYVISIFLLFIFILTSHTQIPDLEIEDEFGNIHQLSDYMSDDNNYLISFWASWCTPCKREFDAWKTYGAVWEDNYNVKILGISIDADNAKEKALEIWALKEWHGSILFAKNEEANVAFNFQTIPQTFLFDKSGNLVYQHSGYSNGDEDELNMVIIDNVSVSTKEIGDSKPEFHINQNETDLQVTSSKLIEDFVVNIYSMNGKLIKSKFFKGTHSTFGLSKHQLNKSSLHVVEIKTNGNKMTQLIFVR